MRRKFTAEQRDELFKLGLYREQVRHLESHALQSISWRLVSPPRMQDVRDKLTELQKALERVEKLYIRVSTPASQAAGEALNRLYLAQQELGYTNLDTLPDSLETATTIVERALKDLPPARRSTRQDSATFVRLILKALQLGHAEHFDCSGYGDAPSKEPMPPFLIRVTRKKPPFPHVVQVVSEASGAWSVDDAIRRYLNSNGGK
ncbi:MAG: hypothetical protein WBW93_17800 [Steroidobacteraceae bacterium]